MVQVPARPFLRPAFEKFRHGAAQRFLERVGAELWRLEGPQESPSTSSSSLCPSNTVSTVMPDGSTR